MVSLGPIQWAQYSELVRDSIIQWEERLALSEANEEGSRESCLALYDECVQDIRSNQHSRTRFRYGLQDASLNEFGGEFAELPPNNLLQGLNGTNRQKMNQSKLQRAWDTSHRSSRDDWEEWMRRVSIQLLKEAPSAALRATANLAQAYPPLSRDLFCAAFACCWEDMNDMYRSSLVHALQTAFTADVSPETLQQLLNLAEFMDHDQRGGLPIEIPVLSDLALKCRAFAKALHYKEREFEITGSQECIEALININRKLDLPGTFTKSVSSNTSVGGSASPLSEAAGGIATACGPAEITAVDSYDETDYPLSFGEMHFGVMFKTAGSSKFRDILANNSSRNDELWLATVGEWADALALHEERLKSDPGNLDAALGCMKCYSANGEWSEVLNCANEYSIASNSSKGMRMCAKAAWRLSQWGELENYVSKLNNHEQARVSRLAAHENATQMVEYDGAFYSAVLNIQKEDWSKASLAIDSARRAMDGTLTALMGESYSRSYPSMVQAQILSEMEEIIEFRKTALVAETSPFNLSSENPDHPRQRLKSVWEKRLAGCRTDVEVYDSVLAVRSLVLEPDEYVDSVLKLSELSRQNKRYKFGERVLLEPLKKMRVNLSGHTFGLGLPDHLAVINDVFQEGDAALPRVIENIVSGDASDLSISYDQSHESFTLGLIKNAGGVEK